MYKIVRFYKRDSNLYGGHLETKRRTIQTRLTLDQAQAHCNRDDTSTLSGAAKKKRGGWDWFDGYTET